MEINPEDITITFVSSHYPRKMLQHIVHTKKINIIKKENGIYYLENSMFPIQLLVVNELSKDENYWLQSLRNNISTNHEMIDLLEHYEKKRYIKWYDAVMDVIVMANRKQIKEESKMSEALNELCEELLADKIKNVREEGKEEGIELAKKILKLFQSNTPTDEIAQQCGISQEQVIKILE